MEEVAGGGERGEDIAVLAKGNGEEAEDLLVGWRMRRGSKTMKVALPVMKQSESQVLLSAEGVGGVGGAATVDVVGKRNREKLATKFNSFTVEEQPGEQVITIRGKFGDREDIKIEATMFDGYEHVPVLGDDSSGVNVLLHLSLLVDISKGEGGNELELVCSAWPGCLSVEKVYILRRGQMPARPYLGPDFRNLNAKIQEKFREYLDARGVNNELSVFLHDYMMNKDRIELLRWMDRLKSFVEK